MPSQTENYTAQAITNVADSYLKGAIDLCLRERFLLSFLLKAGRFQGNCSGTNLHWNVKIKRPRIYTGTGKRPQYEASDTNVQLAIGWARREGTDKLDRETMMVNQGESQIYDLAANKMDDLVSAATETMAADVYGDASADSTQPAGLRTIFQHEITAITDRIAVPKADAVYAGKSMALGAEGGAWSAEKEAADRMNSGLTHDWPDGSGSPQFDYLASKSFNYNGNWSTGSNNWKTNAEKIMRRSKVMIKAQGGAGSAPALHMLAQDMYVDFEDGLVNRERLRISDYATSIGFPDVMRFEDALVAYDYECPAGEGYGLNPMQMEIKTPHDQLFFVDGPTWDIREQAWLMLVGFLGNIRFNPKYFAQYKGYAAP